MAVGKCSGCHERKELYGGTCLQCVASWAAPASIHPPLGHSSERDDHRRARHQDVDERTRELRRQYRSHGNYAASEPVQHHMTAEQRRRLGRHDYALPDHKPAPALPLRNPDIPGSAYNYVRAASARLSMMRNLGHLGPGEWDQGKRNIAAAARRVGLHSHL